MEAVDVIKGHLKESAQVLENFMSNPQNLQRIHQAASMMAVSLRNGGKIISCGNGGSHCDAMHFAEELTGRYRDDRRPLPAIAISDPTYMSCTANDYGYEQVFSRFVEGLGRPGDVLLAISTSGNSPNILRAAEAAKERGMQVVALTGKGGGKLAYLADAEVRVSHNAYADRIQEIHIKVIHIFIYLIEKFLL
jgi:D-sedoheptulose 7-phosphate isomerase